MRLAKLATRCFLVLLLLGVGFPPTIAQDEPVDSEETTASIDQEKARKDDELSTLIESALDLIRNGSIDMGAEELKRLGETGDAEAFFHLAEIRRLGIGAKPSIPVATMFYRLAAQLGHQRAALSLANLLFFDGDDSEETIREAFSIWQLYALRGNPEALYMLGMLYWNGSGDLVKPDPIRAYGLVWRAASKKYEAAIETEIAMSEQLNARAQLRGKQYASNLEEEGFSTSPLAIYLLTGDPADIHKEDREDTELPEPAQPGITPEAQPKSEIAGQEAPTTKPEAPKNWDAVWHLEVGYAMSEEEVTKLQKVIISTQGQAVGDLFSEVTESISRPGLYRLIFGPVDDMGGAVLRCVTLKRAGFDCFARPPR